MSRLRVVMSMSLLGTAALLLGGSACSGSDPQPAANSSDPAIASADSGCRKFCAEQAALAPTCVSDTGDSRILPEALCDKLCMNPSCYIPPGSDPKLVKAFFDCAKTAPQSLCDSANGIAQPVGCASEPGLLSWISGWEFDGKKAVCN